MDKRAKIKGRNQSDVSWEEVLKRQRKKVREGKKDRINKKEMEERGSKKNAIKKLNILNTLK